MIIENPPGDVYVGRASYSDLGFGWSYSNGYWATSPAYQLNNGALTPYADSFPLTVSENVVWNGSQKTDQVEDGFGYYWDSENEDWAYLADGKGFVLRPYFFRYMYDPVDFLVSISTSVSTGSSRAHWKDMLYDTTGNMHFCPVFWTPRGLALPAFSEESNWKFPNYQSSSAGLSMLDCSVWLSGAPYPVVGLCVVGLMDSTASGGLINDRTETLATAFIGQVDGYFSAVANGRPVGYMGLSPWSPFRETNLAYLPWSGKTIKEVCSVSVQSYGGIFK